MSRKCLSYWLRVILVPLCKSCSSFKKGVVLCCPWAGHFLETLLNRTQHYIVWDLKFGPVKLTKSMICQCNTTTTVFAVLYPAVIYLFKVKNENTRTLYEVCSRFTIKTPEQRHWRFSDVFIVNLNRFYTFLWRFHCWLLINPLNASNVLI